MYGIRRLQLALAGCVAVICFCTTVSADDIFFTVTDDDGSFVDVLLGDLPTDSGGANITLGHQTTATIFAWSDANLALDASSVASGAFGYSLEFVNSNVSAVTGITGQTSVNPVVNGGPR